MCGIVGYIGPKQAAPVLVQGLSKLEYRGYDSAGIAVLSEGKIRVEKTKGGLDALRQKLRGSKDVCGCVGIGHTRWATHGAPSVVNAHPHFGRGERIAVVHNGIIENYKPLKQMLEREGFRFCSDTDTEVISQLLTYHYAGDIEKALQKTIACLEGSYALGVLCAEHPDVLYAVRKDSPLVIGIGQGEYFIASDIPAVLAHTRAFYLLEDNEVACLRADAVSITDLQGKRVQKEIFHVDWDVEAAQKGGYAHFMLKEIYEQPQAIRNTIAPYICDGFVHFKDFGMTTTQIQDLSHIHLIGCGSAYHAATVGAYVFENMVHVRAQAELASEFRYRNPLLSASDFVIAISQSGETADTIAAMREAKRAGCKVLAIVNVVGSTLAREADAVVYTCAGPEIAVATTKAYSTQLQVLYMLALHMASVRGVLSDAEHRDIVCAMQKLPEQMEMILQDVSALQAYAAKRVNAQDVFYIGRGLDYCLALEGSLKLKEITYIHSEAYAAGELKHGTISLLEKGSVVLALVTQPHLYEKMRSNIREVTARGATVFAITPQGNAVLDAEVDLVYTIPETHPMLMPALEIVPLQIFAYYVAVGKGCDVDKPRNLAKSVTVE